MSSRILDKKTSVRFLFASVGLIVTLLALTLLDTLLERSPSVSAQSVGVSLNGYAWSETIGWIQMYNVTVGSDASTLQGYGWSENIGWVSFNASELSSCPSGTCNARIVGGALKGWARACAGTVTGTCSGLTRTDGWDGWISLSGSNYGPTLPTLETSGTFSGYAWGSDIVGWVDFSGVTVGNSITTAISISANPSRVRRGENTTLSWNVSGMSFCGVTGSDGSEPALTTAGNATDGAHTAPATVNQSTVYTLTCTNAVGTTYRGRVTVSITPITTEL